MRIGRIRAALASSAAAAAIMGFAGVALAQGAPQGGPAPQNLRGEIKSVSGDTVILAERSGDMLTLKLPESAPVGVLVAARLDDVKPGLFIAVTAMPMPDGKLNAQVVQIFAPGQRPAPGHRPWDVAPGATMTNADVDGVVAGSGGSELKVKYQDGEKTVLVTPATQIVAVAPPDRSQLRPGQYAFAFGAKQADGSYNLIRISVGKDGLKPAM